MALHISGFVAIIGYLISQLRNGILLPPPLMGALVVMALLMIPLASTLPDLGGETIVESDARSPSFICTPERKWFCNLLDDLMEDKKAVYLVELHYLHLLTLSTKVSNWKM